MNRTKMLTILAAALFLLNMGTITALILGKPKHPPGQEGRSPKELIIDRLQFDDAQIAQYQQLIEKHKQQMEEKQAVMKPSRNELYQMLQSENKNQKDSLTQLIGKTLLEIEEINFKHFEDIKAICKPSQLENYNALTADLARLFNQPPPKKR